MLLILNYDELIDARRCRHRHCYMLLLLLFRCCNQRLPTELLSSIADAGADAPAVATGDQSTAVIADAPA